MRLHIEGLWGLGDNIFQRPFIRAATAQDEVYIDTPWPELYADLPVKFVRNPRREGRLRTQTKNIQRQVAGRYVALPPGARHVRVGYGHSALATGSIVAAIERILPLRGERFVFDLPDMGPCPITTNKPIALIRPATVRREWRNEARNPRPEYVAQLAARLMQTHCVVSVADLKPGEEWLEGAPPPATARIHAGELNTRELLALARDASIIVGGVGWIVPASCALRTPCFVILGGHGGHNAPQKITDRRMPLDWLGFATPDHFCPCSNMLHRCNKTISNLTQQFDRWLASIGEDKIHARRFAA